MCGTLSLCNMEIFATCWLLIAPSRFVTVLQMAHQPSTTETSPRLGNMKQDTISHPTRCDTMDDAFVFARDLRLFLLLPEVLVLRVITYHPGFRYSLTLSIRRCFFVIIAIDALLISRLRKNSNFTIQSTISKTQFNNTD